MNDIHETLVRMIREIIGEDWELDHRIGAATSFNTDLEMESIEFVALAEKLKSHYGEQVDFVGWFSRKELDEIIELRVGDVAGYIEGCISAEKAG